MQQHGNVLLVQFCMILFFPVKSSSALSNSTKIYSTAAQMLPQRNGEKSGSTHKPRDLLMPRLFRCNLQLVPLVHQSLPSLRFQKKQHRKTHSVLWVSVVVLVFCKNLLLQSSSCDSHFSKMHMLNFDLTKNHKGLSFSRISSCSGCFVLVTTA